MKAIFLNCSLKKSPAESSTEALSKFFAKELEVYSCSSEIIRIADFNVLPGVSSDEGEGDDWPMIKQKILSCEILIMASPTWIGTLSSFAMRVIERMDGLLSETDEFGRPVVYNHVAGFACVGNEDGAKHTIGEMEAALIDIGFTVPGHPWAFFNNGSKMGPTYIETVDDDIKKRTHDLVKKAAKNLVSVARALQTSPIPA